MFFPIERNKDIIQQFNRIDRRINHISEVKQSFYLYFVKIQEIQCNYSQKIQRQMNMFEQRIVKNSFYSTDKANFITNISKVYRQFFIQIEKNTKMNLLNLEKVKEDQIIKQENKLRSKCQKFLKEFNVYISEQQKFNKTYASYSRQCNKLDDIISKFQSYSEPILFYNQTLTHEYLSELQKEHTNCSNSETVILTDTQLLDQKRKWLGQNVKEVNENYVFLLHNHLITIEQISTCIVDPKKDLNFEKGKLSLRKSSEDNQSSIFMETELQRLNNVYSPLNSNPDIQIDDIFSDFSELFKKDLASSQISSDDKFFYDRCENIRNKKLKNLKEIINLQQTLFQQLKNQRNNQIQYEQQIKNIEKEIFKNNGIESFRKRFRKYFGSNMSEIGQLCFTVIDRQRKSFERMEKNISDSKQKLYKTISEKKECIQNFDRRTKNILDDHLKLKQKINIRNTVDQALYAKFKNNVKESFNEFKKIFNELQSSEKKYDLMFFDTIKAHYNLVIKEGISKNLRKILQKQKNRINILKNLHIDSEIILIVKEDSRYEMLLNECPKPTLYINFQSKIKKRQYEQTKIILQKKQTRLKGMIKSKVSCCGIKSEPIKHNVLSSHECKILDKEEMIKGALKISAVGIIFEEKSWNPFADKIQLLIPQNDIISFDTKTLEKEKEGVELITDMGALQFESKQKEDIVESIQKNIAFKVVKQQSERGVRDRKDSSNNSFFKNNTTSQFVVSFDKSANQGKLIGGVKTEKGLKTKSSSKNSDDYLKEFVKKWIDTNTFPENFVEIVKNIPAKSNSRRDFSYRSGHIKFFLKQKKDYELQGKNNLVLQYVWKVSFPESPMLNSFKHSERIRIQLVAKDQLKLTITEGKVSEEQLFIKNKFYKEIQDLNNKGLPEFISQALERHATVFIEPENDENKDSDSCNIILDDINLEDRQSKFQKFESMNRTSRLEKQRSTLSMSGNFMK